MAGGRHAATWRTSCRRRLASRSIGRRAAPARLGALEYGNPIFEPFRAPRSGDFSAARFYGYRAVTPAKGAQILARFDDGAPALVERRVGNGRVLMWTSSLDLQWNDLPLKRSILPFVHRMVDDLAAYREQARVADGRRSARAGTAGRGAGRARAAPPRWC